MHLSSLDAYRMARRCHVAFSALLSHWLLKIIACQHKHGRNRYRIIYRILLYDDILKHNPGTLRFNFIRGNYTAVCCRKAGLLCGKYLVKTNFGKIFPAVLIFLQMWPETRPWSCKNSVLTLGRNKLFGMKSKILIQQSVRMNQIGRNCCCQDPNYTDKTNQNLLTLMLCKLTAKFLTFLWLMWYWHHNLLKWLSCWR